MNQQAIQMQLSKRKEDLLNSSTVGADTGFIISGANSGTPINTVTRNGTPVDVIDHIDDTKYHKQPVQYSISIHTIN